jgi:hypothetical protein
MGDHHASSDLQECQRVAITSHIEHQDDAAGGTLEEGEPVSRFAVAGLKRLPPFLPTPASDAGSPRGLGSPSG